MVRGSGFESLVRFVRQISGLSSWEGHVCNLYPWLQKHIETIRTRWDTEDSSPLSPLHGSPTKKLSNVPVLIIEVHIWGKGQGRERGIKCRKTQGLSSTL
jgi:hypothetical protein